MSGQLLLLLLPLFSQGVLSLTLNRYYGNGMVLQREVSTSIWGYGVVTTDKLISSCSTGEFEETPYQVSEGTWRVDLQAQPAGTTCDIRVSGGETELSLSGVIYGDVWLCSGQSNMEQAMLYIENAQQEIEDSADYGDGIRFTVVENTVAEEADDDLEVLMSMPWMKAEDSEYLGYMSAVCFLFARKIYDELDIPIGLIASDWGGTPVEAWSNQQTLDRCGIAPSCNEAAQQNCNSYLWNAMINPLKRNAVKGFLWYQGEANGGYNRDLYNCSFPAMIDSWREEFSANSATDPLAPFGFVQLSTWRADNMDSGFPIIRWHQTADYGMVPNERMQKVFMSSPQDTFDPDTGYPGNIHPRYKQIVAERLAIAGLNVAYGLTDFPTKGPYPVEIAVEESMPIQLVIYYDSDFEFKDSEISGFYFCENTPAACDAGWTVDLWQQIPKADVTAEDSRVIRIVMNGFPADMSGKSLAYIWRESPVKEYLGLPIYAKNSYSLPSPPWKLQIL